MSFLLGENKIINTNWVNCCQDGVTVVMKGFEEA
jgi:hypothetical protein